MAAGLKVLNYKTCVYATSNGSNLRTLALISIGFCHDIVKVLVHDRACQVFHFFKNINAACIKV
jgi:hypothetical protein